MVIQFKCPICNNQLSAGSDYADKVGKCQCGAAVIVPGNTDRMRFSCSLCRKGINVSKKHAGKKGKCSRCRGIVDVPVLGVLIPPTSPAASAASMAGASAIMISFLCKTCGVNVYADQESAGHTIECSDCGSFIEVPGKHSTE